MRTGFNSEFLKDENGRVIAVNLGSDYCAEHEWGIASLRKLLGVADDEKIFGIERRRITRVSEGEVLFLDEPQRKKRGTTTLMVACGVNFYVQGGKPPYAIQPIRSRWNRETQKSETLEYAPLTCAWSESDLGIHAETPEDRENLREIYQAMVRGDAALWLGGGEVFENAGLIIGIISRIPEKHKETMRLMDEDHYRRKQAAASTGIEEKLKKAGKRWFALSPRWSHGIKSTNQSTRHSVVFWLNPMDQHLNNSGWFSVEDLEQWIEGKGPIPKTKEAAQ